MTKGVDDIMSIKIIAGRSGSGKTHYARHKAAELARSGKRAVIITPEQFSFETERAMLDILEPKQVSYVKVLSFTRLASRISEEVGGFAGKRLEEYGRAAVMSLALDQVKDHLTLYVLQKKNQDFVCDLLSEMHEFKSCSITADMLDAASEKTDEALLARKLKELSLIYAAYEACVSRIDSIDPLDDLTRLAVNLEKSDYFSETTVILDSFVGFTRQELKVLKRISEQCDEFIITLCCDYEALCCDCSEQRGDALFSAVYDTIKALFDFGQEIHIERLSSHPRFVSAELAYVESGAFRLGSVRPYEASAENVTVYSARDKYDEMEYVAREIRRLVRERDMRWRDFAVICRNAGEYQNELLRALELQGVPCFCDKRASITDSPIIRFVMAAFEAVIGRWRSEDVLRWAATGMIDGLELVDISELENYCFIWRINGDRWRESFAQSPYGYDGGNADDEQSLLDRINAVRERTVELLSEFEQSVFKKGAKGIDIAGAVYDLIDSSGCAECVDRLLKELSPEEAGEQRQIWETLMNILDQFAEIFSDSIMSPREFYELFKLMANLCDVGKIPQNLDQVVFGAADRIRTANPRAVFVIGANDGIFPMTPSQGGIFTEGERKKLAGLDLPIIEDAEKDSTLELFLAYSAMTCASEMLYITYSDSSNGETLYRSEIVSEITRLLPRCRKLKYCAEASPDMIEAPEAGFLTAAAVSESHTEFSESLLECYRRRGQYADKIEVIRRAGKNTRFSIKNPRLARRLFGDNMKISPSKAESFYRCKFAYFCKYGMKSRPLRRADMDPLEYGNIVHHVLERLLGECDLSLLAETDEKDIRKKIELYLEEYLDEALGGTGMKTSRFIYLFRRLANTMTVLAVQLAEEFAGSLFKPMSFELPVDGREIKPLRLKLSDGSELVVEGKIDRVDVFNRDGKNYVRVVDYKTGSKEFLLSDVLSGLNMQMLIYLDILCGGDNANLRLEPAGVVYSPASLGRINGVRGKTGFDDERRKSLRKNGMILESPEIIEAMEQGMETKSDKNNNLCLKGAGTFRSSTCVVSAAQLDTIREYVHTELERMGDSLHNGEIEAVPAKGLYDACAYCDYRVLCSSDRRENGREILKRSIADTMEIMERECGGDDGREKMD